MSRSRRKAIIKDRPRNYKKSSMYWRKIRRTSKNFFKSNDLDEGLIPQPKEIYNDYDYCDYIFNYEYMSSSDLRRFNDFSTKIRMQRK